MTTEAQTQQTQTQLTGFQQTYLHHTKIEENSKGEARITVSIYSNDTETAKNEVLRYHLIVCRFAHFCTTVPKERIYFFNIFLRDASCVTLEK